VRATADRPQQPDLKKVGRLLGIHLNEIKLPSS